MVRLPRLSRAKSREARPRGSAFLRFFPSGGPPRIGLPMRPDASPDAFHWRRQGMGPGTPRACLPPACGGQGR